MIINLPGIHVLQQFYYITTTDIYDVHQYECKFSSLPDTIFCEKCLIRNYFIGEANCIASHIGNELTLETSGELLLQKFSTHHSILHQSCYTVVF